MAHKWAREARPGKFSWGGGNATPFEPEAAERIPAAGPHPPAAAEYLSKQFINQSNVGTLHKSIRLTTIVYFKAIPINGCLSFFATPPIPSKVNNKYVLKQPVTFVGGTELRAGERADAWRAGGVAVRDAVERRLQDSQGFTMGAVVPWPGGGSPVRAPWEGTRGCALSQSGQKGRHAMAPPRASQPWRPPARAREIRNVPPQECHQCAISDPDGAPTGLDTFFWDQNDHFWRPGGPGQPRATVHLLAPQAPPEGPRRSLGRATWRGECSHTTEHDVAGMIICDFLWKSQRILSLLQITCTCGLYVRLPSLLAFHMTRARNWIRVMLRAKLCIVNTLLLRNQLSAEPMGAGAPVKGAE
eukprot:gene10329-biopygen21304